MAVVGPYFPSQENLEPQAKCGHIEDYPVKKQLIDGDEIRNKGPEDLFEELGRSPQGLSGGEAQKRLEQYCPNGHRGKEGEPYPQVPGLFLETYPMDDRDDREGLSGPGVQGIQRCSSGHFPDV